MGITRHRFDIIFTRTHMQTLTLPPSTSEFRVHVDDVAVVVVASFI